ncbi:hypothetical protein [Flavobacterium sp. 25HG05S-40]|uniref:hypothetical protein n=1 Tax=Flavobacterium sp. 25HG05S-40 TaxID=3458682 RepID=UPI004044534A
MREKILTYVVISLVLINVWTLYLFFDYFTEKDAILHSLGLFLNFVYTLVTVVVLGGLLLVIRLVFHWQKRDNPLQVNFFYIFSGIFNLNIFLIWLSCMSLDILELGSGRLEIGAFCSLLVAVLILADVYQSSFKTIHSEEALA